MSIYLRNSIHTFIPLIPQFSATSYRCHCPLSSNNQKVPHPDSLSIYLQTYLFQASFVISFGKWGTIIDSINMSATFFYFVAHTFMYVQQITFCHQSFAYATLIGDNKDMLYFLAPCRNHAKHIRQELKFPPTLDIIIRAKTVYLHRPCQAAVYHNRWHLYHITSFLKNWDFRKIFVRTFIIFRNANVDEISILHKAIQITFCTLQLQDIGLKWNLSGNPLKKSPDLLITYMPPLITPLSQYFFSSKSTIRLPFTRTFP